MFSLKSIASCKAGILGGMQISCLCCHKYKNLVVAYNVKSVCFTSSRSENLEQEDSTLLSTSLPNLVLLQACFDPLG